MSNQCPYHLPNVWFFHSFIPLGSIWNSLWVSPLAGNVTKMLQKNLAISLKFKVNLVVPCLGVISTERELENLLAKRRHMIFLHPVRWFTKYWNFHGISGFQSIPCWSLRKQRDTVLQFRFIFIFTGWDQMKLKLFAIFFRVFFWFF